MKRERETCDNCGEVVGYYDPTLPEGEKIVITRLCSCVRIGLGFGGSPREKK